MVMCSVTPQQEAASNLNEVRLGMGIEQAQLVGSLSQQAAGSGYLNSEAILGNKIQLLTGLLAAN